MSDQAIYDAVRSRISSCDVGAVIADVVRSQFDISNYVYGLHQELCNVAECFLQSALDMQRPFVLHKPRIFPDGNMWCALYGENLQEGVAGFGETPEQASIQFDVEWLNSKIKSSPKNIFAGIDDVVAEERILEKEAEINLSREQYRMDYNNPYQSGSDAFIAGILRYECPADYRTSANHICAWEQGWDAQKEKSK